MMFSSTRNVEHIYQLIQDIREYGSLRLERFEFDMASKLALIVGMLVTGAIVSVLALTVVVFLSLAAGYALESLVGSKAMAMLIIAVVYLIIAITVFMKRHSWIINPLTLFLHELFIPNKSQDE